MIEKITQYRSYIDTFDYGFANGWGLMRLDNDEYTLILHVMTKDRELAEDMLTHLADLCNKEE